MLLAPAIDLIEIHGLQLFGDLARQSAADLAPVDSTYRRNFRRGTSKECLVRDIHLIAGNAPLFNSQTTFRGKNKHGMARYALQTGGQIGGIEDAVTDDKNILAGAFRYIAF